MRAIPKTANLKSNFFDAVSLNQSNFAALHHESAIIIGPNVRGWVDNDSRLEYARIVQGDAGIKER